jgi:oxygen-independent coproporphyrinogen-3 oxidase
LIHKTHPLNPPLEQVYFHFPNYRLFQRGKELERGRSPLSSEFPSPAINTLEHFPIYPAGEGIRGEVSADKQKQTEPIATPVRGFCYNDTVTRSIALYVHFPFCRRKCRYCDFVSYEGREEDIPVYLSAVKKEISHCGGGENIGSIYFGGGTPSLMTPEQIGDVLATIRSCFAVTADAEISIEANPGTVDLQYLTEIRRLGVNRLSLGVQSLNDRELSLMGRIHCAAQAKEAFHQARDAGFSNINLDFIYGLPGQSLADWRDTLEGALALAPEHLSLYALTLEPRTPLWQAVEDKKVPAIDSDLAADQYELAEDMLAAHGFRHYEISNWAEPGRECRHNLVYWWNEPYRGIGVAAHSCLDGHRFANTSNLEKYLAAALPPQDLDEVITPGLRLAETIILGLRLDAGIAAASVAGRHRQTVAEMTDLGLMESCGESLRLTRRGRLLSNEVFWRFLPDEK